MEPSIGEIIMKTRQYPFNLIADYIYEYYKLTEDTPFEILEIDAKDLIIPERIDLTVKYYFIQCRETGDNLAFAEELYTKHIEAFTDGMYLEFGNKEKNSIQKYIDTFCNLMDDMKQNGFHPEISLIPVGKENVLLDGAHRAAIAAYFGQKVKVIRFQHLSVCFNHKYFRKHLLEEKYIEFMVKEYCKLKQNTYMVFLWPRAYKYRAIVMNRLGQNGSKFIYSNKVKIPFEQFFPLVYQIYQREPWVGNEQNHYRGALKKAQLCYEKEGRMKIFVIEGIAPSQISQVKADIRKELGLKKNSLHITDKKEETLEALDIIMSIGKSKDINGRLIANDINKTLAMKKRLRNIYARCILSIKKRLGIPV